MVGGSREVSRIHSVGIGCGQVGGEAKSRADEWWLLLTLCLWVPVTLLFGDSQPQMGVTLTEAAFWQLGVCIIILAVKNKSPPTSLFFGSHRLVSPEAFQLHSERKGRTAMIGILSSLPGVRKPGV